MSLLDSIKTLQLDPVIFNQQRCEFRLDPKVYLSNWRLADIRAVSSNDGTADNINGKGYVVGAGAYALIKSIVLYNDTTVIANLYNASDYLSFANQGRTNSNSVNMARYLNRNDVGYDFNSNDKIQRATPMSTDGGLEPIAPSQVITDSDVTTTRAWLDLTLPLPFLKATPIVNGQELRDLRLVIEWAEHSTVDEIKDIVTGKDGTITNGKLQINRPTLIVDEMIDPKAISRVRNQPVSYINLDSERVVVNNGTLDVKQRLGAFDDRTVRRMLIANKSSSGDAAFGKNYSQAMFGEKINFSLNGQQLIPYQGIDSDMKKQAYLTDAWGLRNQPQTSQLYKASGSQEINSLSTNYDGKLSYGGLRIDSEIDELLLDYQRKKYEPVSVQFDSITSANPAVITLKEPMYMGVATELTIAGATGGQSAALNEAKPATAVADNPTKFELTGVDTSSGGNINVDNATATVKTNDSNTSVQAFNMLFWGEVQKVMTVKDNRVSVSV